VEGVRHIQGCLQARNLGRCPSLVKGRDEVLSAGMTASSIQAPKMKPNTASKAPQKEKVHSDPVRYASISEIAYRNSESP
jgi:hypothetical protein